MGNVSKCFFCANKKDYDAELGYFGCAYSGQECKEYSMFEPKEKPKTRTNYNNLREMSLTELAAWLADHPLVSEYDENNPKHKAWLEWLRQEVNDGRN